VPHRGFIWHVDVYEGILNGVTLDEVEIAKEDAPVTLPDWIGQDVTGKPEYKKLNMLRARLTGAAWSESYIDTNGSPGRELPQF
jgi:CYTH domain-containing protein